MMAHMKTIAFAGTLLLALTNADAFADEPKAPDIPFAPERDTSLKDLDNPEAVFRVDMAKVERDWPLSRTDLMKITPKNLEALSQDQVDQIYGRITAGPVPDGIYRGTLFFAKADTNSPITGDRESRIRDAMGGLLGILAEKKIGAVERVGKLLWKGKVFFRDKGYLRNMIEDLRLLNRKIDREDTVPKVTIPRFTWLNYSWVRSVPFLSNDVNLLFPAKLYCGQSLMDSRRESVIVDYYFNDEIEEYRDSPDSLAGRNGLKIRDEIRMIRPGFYLGRAYINKIFLLNFTLYNEEVAEKGAAGFQAGDPVAEECWAGEQQRAAALK